MAYLCFIVCFIFCQCITLSSSGDVFTTSQLTHGTHKKDIQGLASLQDSFEVLKIWSGDPCFPAHHTWDWVQCNDDAVPRVTSLLLGRNGLSGLLPDFSSMDALQKIDVHNNNLRGPIPDFLGALPNLKSLNIANNHFNGTVPAALLSTNNGLSLSLEGNSLQLPPPSADQFSPRLKHLYRLAPTLPLESRLGSARDVDSLPPSGTPNVCNSNTQTLIIQITIPSSLVSMIIGAIGGICCRRRIHY